MRPTKSKQRLLYYKSLRALEREKWNLEKKARNSSEYVEIPKTLAGYKIRLVLIESLRNKDAGLAEAVEAATSYFVFGEKPFRLCNLKKYRCEYCDGQYFRWRSDGEEKMKSLYFADKLYKKGQLKLLSIDEHQYEKLSDLAKKYFVQRLDESDSYHKSIFRYKYEPLIPTTYVREAEEKLYWTALRLPDSESESKAKRIANHLDFHKECELWHYEGCHTSRWEKWEKKLHSKKRRTQCRAELRDFLMTEF